MWEQYLVLDHLVLKSADRTGANEKLCWKANIFFELSVYEYHHPQNYLQSTLISMPMIAASLCSMWIYIYINQRSAVKKFSGSCLTFVSDLSTQAQKIKSSMLKNGLIWPRFEIQRLKNDFIWARFDHSYIVVSFTPTFLCWICGLAVPHTVSHPSCGLSFAVNSRWRVSGNCWTSVRIQESCSMLNLFANLSAASWPFCVALKTSVD